MLQKPDVLIVARLVDEAHRSIAPTTVFDIGGQGAPIHLFAPAFRCRANTAGEEVRPPALPALLIASGMDE